MYSKYGLKGKKIQCSENNKTIKLLITTNTLIECLNFKILKLPHFQRPIDNDKVLEIKKTIDKDILNWALRHGDLTIGLIDSVYYVIDGQHRLMALKQKLEEQTNYNDTIMLTIIDFKRLSEMQEHFKIININSKINPIYTEFNEIFIYNGIKLYTNWLLDTYKNAFCNKKTKTNNNRNMTIDDFISQFTSERLTQFYSQLTGDDYGDITKLKEKTIKANEETKKKLIEHKMDRKYYMIDIEFEKCIKNEFYLAYNNINFIDMIIDNETIEILQIENKKKKITKVLKKAVWKKESTSLDFGICWCCEEQIEFDNFECGHIIPECMGGKTELDNLEPICSKCNKDCGIENMNIYKNALYKLNMQQNKKLN